MKTSLIAAVLIIDLAACLTLPVATLAQAPLTAGKPARSQQINITSDSQRGWVPSPQQMQQVRLATEKYLSALDEERYMAAYDLLTRRNRTILPFDKFSSLQHDFYRQSGRLIRREILRLTWTKYPETFPTSGVYAAVDFAGRFENIDRQCGYIVLYQESVSQPFQVMRFENNFLTNDMAAEMERQKSRSELDQLWAKLAANCPNYSPPTSP